MKRLIWLLCIAVPILAATYTPFPTIYQATAVATASGSSTSAQTLIGTGAGSLTLPANYFYGAGVGLTMHASGYYTSGTITTQTLTFTLKFGSTTVLVSSAVTPISGVTNGVWEANCVISALTVGSSGTVQPNCSVNLTGSTLTPGDAPMVNTSAVTINTTTSQAITWTATWGGSPTSSQTITGSTFALTTAYIQPTIAASNTFTLVTHASVFCNGGGTTCSIYTPGAGDLVYQIVTNSTGAADYLVSASGGGTWVVPAGAQITDNTVGAISSGYTLSSAATSITDTFSTGATYNVNYFEYSFTLGSTSLDGSCGAADNTTASTMQNGVPLTLSGMSDVIPQGTIGATTIGGPSSISSPYTNLISGSQFDGAADLENAASGAAPTWTWGASQKSVVNACAFK